MRILLFTMILGVWSAEVHCAENPNDVVAQLDSELNKLIAAGDSALAASYYAADFVLTTSSGIQKTKSDMLREIGSHKLTIEVNETRDVKVRVLGATAVLTGILHQKGMMEGTSFDVDLWVTDTWVRGGPHGWRLFAGHATRTHNPG